MIKQNQRNGSQSSDVMKYCYKGQNWSDYDLLCFMDVKMGNKKLFMANTNSSNKSKHLKPR